MISEILKEKKFCNASDDSKLISLFEANPPHSHPLSLIADEVLLEMNQCFQSKYFDTTIQWIKELYSRADFLRLCDPLFMKEFSPRMASVRLAKVLSRGYSDILTSLTMSIKAYGALHIVSNLISGKISNFICSQLPSKLGTRLKPTAPVVYDRFVKFLLKRLFGIWSTKSATIHATNSQK